MNSKYQLTSRIRLEARELRAFRKDPICKTRYNGLYKFSSFLRMLKCDLKEEYNRQNAHYISARANITQISKNKDQLFIE